MNKVFVSGLGVVTPVGRNAEEFVASLREGKCGIRPVGKKGEALGLHAAALLTDFDFEQSLSEFDGLPEQFVMRARKAARRAPLSVQVSVVAALQAWCQAGLENSLAIRAAAHDPHRVSLVVAGQNINQAHVYDIQKRFGDRLDYLSPQYGMSFMDTYHVGVVSELLDIHGEGFTVGGASASGNVGLIHGYRLVKYGLADICLVVGALTDLSPLEIQAFKNMGAMGGKSIETAEAVCRPFDQRHEGFVYGQGGACVILESEASVIRRRIKPLTELAGTALALDGNRSSDPSIAGEVGVMRRALSEAGLSPADVQYLNAHGTSSVLGDETEVAAIKEVFGDWVRHLNINSTKGLVGHCLFSAGVIEAVATILQMASGFVHRNVNLDHPIDDDCNFVGGEARMLNIESSLSNSFGFGGINSAVVFRRSAL